MKLIEIPLDPFPEGRTQRKSSNDDRIKINEYYLAKIGNGWYAGRFTKQWYGWNFQNWGCSGIQLDSIEGPLYRIEETSSVKAKHDQADSQ